MKYVQFSDAKKTEVVSLFGSPQDPKEHPNQDIVEDDDPRVIAFEEAMAKVQGI